MSKAFKSDWHFAVPVFSKEIPGFEEHREPLAELFLQKSKETAGIKRSNLNAWHSENNLHHWKSEHVKWLIGEIAGFAQASLAAVDPKMKKNDLVLTSMWANVGELGAWHAPHHHIPSAWSGVYYVSVDKALKGQKAKTPGGKLEFLHPYPIVSAFGFATSAVYTAKDGTMLLFPSFLQHLVHPNMSDHPRIAVSFNMNFATPQDKGG